MNVLASFAAKLMLVLSAGEFLIASSAVVKRVAFSPTPEATIRASEQVPFSISIEAATQTIAKSPFRALTSWKENP